MGIGGTLNAFGGSQFMGYRKADTSRDPESTLGNTVITSDYGEEIYDPVQKLITTMANKEITQQDIYDMGGSGRLDDSPYSPITLLTEKVHLADIYSGLDKKLADREIDYYIRAVDLLKPYITNTNPDGTYDLLIPKGVDLLGRSVGDFRQEQDPTLWQDDTKVTGLKMITNGDRSQIFDFIFTGNRSAFAAGKAYNLKSTGMSAAAGSEVDTAKRIQENRAKNTQFKEDLEVRRGRVTGLGPGNGPNVEEARLSRPTLLGGPRRR